jgi:hypothetical protein
MRDHDKSNDTARSLTCKNGQMSDFAVDEKNIRKSEA